MLDAGLLTADYWRPPERSGPGAGRSAKYYRPSDIELDVTIPPRRYEQLATFLVRALRSADAAAVRGAATRVAYECGEQDGTALRQQQQLCSPQPTLTVLTDFLQHQGYEPYRGSDGVLGLGNCPFDDLAQSGAELVCAVNHAYLQGVFDALDGLAAQDVVMACRRRGDCCVLVGSVEQ